MANDAPKFRPRPAPFRPVRPGLFRTTPPAVFPPILGLFGLGLAWRRGSGMLGIPAGAEDVFLGGVTLLFLFAALAYLAKLMRRPGVLAEDLRVLPGRGGLSAGVMCLYTLALAVHPFSAGLAKASLFAGLALHAVLVAALVWLMRGWPPEQRRVTPLWHLHFVGAIVGALAAARLGFGGIAQGLLIAEGVIAAAIWVASLDQFRRESVPAPLRPLLAVHLAPAAYLGMVADALGHATAAQGFAVLCAVMLLALVLAAQWLTAAGFTPMWGSFTFPVAAAAGLWIGLGGLWAVPGTIVFLAALVGVPVIAYRILKLWMTGALARVTNAAAA